jgi:hypothetical protein
MAVTRAKLQIFIVGDTETLSTDCVLSYLVNYSRENGRVLPLVDFIDE